MNPNTEFDLRTYFERELTQHSHVFDSTRSMIFPTFSRFVSECLQALRTGNKIVLFGNGGSAADAQHIATELTVRFKENRGALSAVALTTDTSALTAIGNDFGFDHIFSRQVEALCNKGDVAVGISTSGNSENVLQGLRAARERGAVTIGLGGGDGGRMKDLADYSIIVPSTMTARIQEMHILIGHMLCGALEQELFGSCQELRREK